MDREIILVLTLNLAEQILREHGIYPDAISAYQLEIHWNSDGTYRVRDWLLLRPAIPVDDIVASRDRRYRTLSPTRH